MILECTKCHARFLVADSMVPPEGRTVRCGACSHQWFVTKPAGNGGATDASLAMPEPFVVPEAPLADDEAAAETSNVPAISKPPFSARPYKIAVPVLALVWFGLAFVAYFPRWMHAPGLSALYAAIGTTPSDGLVFDDVHMDHEQNDERTKYIISGSIVNHAAEDRLVPTVYVALKDKRGKALWGREYPVDTVLKAGAVYPFRIDNIETSFADKISSIVVDIGNSMQLMMR